MVNAREIAYDLTRRVNAEGAFLGLLLRYNLGKSGLDSRDRALVAELTYGLQRHRGKLDYIIENFSKRPLDEIDPEILDLLRLGIYQISEMRIPVHASVNETVGLAKSRLHKGAASFVNAVLRNASAGLKKLSWPSRDDLPRYLETIYSHPRWLVEYILGFMDSVEAEKLCAADNNFAGLTLRVNPSRTDRESLLAEIHSQGGRASLSPHLKESLIEVHLPHHQLQGFLDRGLCVVQDESSMLVGHSVQPSPGKMVIDACAAPGGKATHLAQLGSDTCRVIALDSNARRLEALRKVIDRLGIDNIAVLHGNAALLEKYVEIPADAILVDAPCSGLGTLRRKPELKWRRTQEELIPLAEMQLAMLNGCAGMVHPGGALVYAVCTFTGEETLDVLKVFLDLHPEYQLENLAPYLPPTLKAGVRHEGYIQLMPHLHDMEGMFIARLVRSDREARRS